MIALIENKQTKAIRQYQNVTEVYFADSYVYIIWWTNHNQRMESRHNIKQYDVAVKY